MNLRADIIAVCGVFVTISALAYKMGGGEEKFLFCLSLILDIIIVAYSLIFISPNDPTQSQASDDSKSNQTYSTQKDLASNGPNSEKDKSKQQEQRAEVIWRAFYLFIILNCIIIAYSLILISISPNDTTPISKVNNSEVNQKNLTKTNLSPTTSIVDAGSRTTKIQVRDDKYNVDVNDSEAINITVSRINQYPVVKSLTSNVIGPRIAGSDITGPSMHRTLRKIPFLTCSSSTAMQSQIGNYRINGLGRRLMTMWAKTRSRFG